MSGEQQLLYAKYHDVLLHDNTALTNKYKWPLSLFLIVDCNNKSRLLAQAFIQDETEESYIWLLQCLKRTNIEPKTIITDADPAMIGALQQELPDTFHVTCIYHLSQNLPKRLKSILGKDYMQFLNDFYIARNSISEDTFEFRWKKLQEKYPQAENYLTNTLYKTKESWAYCYTLKIFTSGIQSTQRVEGLNAIIHKEIESSMSLTMACEKILKRLEVENMTQRYVVTIRLWPYYVIIRI
jgi:transposase-like protein